uniref:Transporter n=1 Tax=Chromera velia CCMP2878 TaxID=1169474 RepID=A0A0G4GBT5_9ALVE|eukprot:Cvel_21181.t1-p1 / transcript=Cvel_21181.t1 / gene=Cvel_21181 / organism=Chromera_velia_CCMP2878 / gene_product=Sodium- and chloride-dependent GABA transporter 2, putative / transcript_product=Sodium- and chloride-dependent GABA transporter 2, putative / location=Cvel_scaffold1966:8527-12057(-) / protein_length=912 / sequence_SO=supercontig / SO=protein_coding / is_pseudo=false
MNTASSSMSALCEAEEGAHVGPLAQVPVTESESNGQTISGETAPAEQPVEEKKARWGNQAEFILTLVGYAVGLGNIWRFPYLVFSNGGAAFLIPYVCISVGLGVPIFALEVGTGQLFQKGLARVWRDLSAWTAGCGLASTLVCFVIGLYYNVLITYALFYLGVSFSTEVPWKQGADTYLKETVLNVSGSGNEIGMIQWQLLIPFALAWLLIFGILFKGVQSFGKVVYFTATFPYVVLIALLVRAVTMEGAWLGLQYYLIPDWSRVYDPLVWVAAGQQVFFSLSVGWGTYTTFGALNPPSYNFFKDAWMIPFIDAFTAFMAGCAVFGVLGFLSLQEGVPVDQLDLQGVRLAFVAYPTAIAHMPIAPLWSVAFFIMLIALGVGSQFGITETVVDTLIETGFAVGGKRWATVAVVCMVSFGIGLIFITRGGLYYLGVTDGFAFMFALFIILLVEVFAVCVIYGTKKFVRGLDAAVGRRMPRYFPIMWQSVVPLLLLGLTGSAGWKLYSGFHDGSFGRFTCPPKEEGRDEAFEECLRETRWVVPVGISLAFVVLTPLFIAPCFEACRRKRENERVAGEERKRMSEQKKSTSEKGTQWKITTEKAIQWEGMKGESATTVNEGGSLNVSRSDLRHAEEPCVNAAARVHLGFAEHLSSRSAKTAAAVVCKSLEGGVGLMIPGGGVSAPPPSQSVSRSLSPVQGRGNLREMDREIGWSEEKRGEREVQEEESEKGVTMLTNEEDDFQTPCSRLRGVSEDNIVVSLENQAEVARPERDNLGGQSQMRERNEYAFSHSGGMFDAKKDGGTKRLTVSAVSEGDMQDGEKEGSFPLSSAVLSFPRHAEAETGMEPQSEHAPRVPVRRHQLSRSPLKLQQVERGDEQLSSRTKTLYCTVKEEEGTGVSAERQVKGHVDDKLVGSL